MRKRILVAASACLAAVLVSACAGTVTAPTAATILQSTEYTCAAASAALKYAETLGPKLSAADNANIGKAISVLDPICSQATVPTVTSDEQAVLTAALNQITATTNSK